jgi:hypothetical protein
VNRVIAALAGLGLLVAAGLVAETAPSPAVLQEPIPVAAAVGQRAQGRDIVVTVQGIALARTLRSDDWTGTASGVWVVVRLRAETRLTSGAVTGSLTAGGRTWNASDRPPVSLDQTSTDPGLPVEGVLAFEVPRSALVDGVVLQLGRTLRPQADSAIRVRLALAVARVRPSLRVDAPQGAGS